MASHTEESPLPIEISAEPLVGWRCWFVLPHELLLRPIYKRGLVWRPREPLQAVCPDDLHEVPADGCKCGVWTVCHPMLLDEIGWTTAPPDDRSPLPGVMVVGEVSLWGNIVQHERGWRASCAYPRHLYVFTDDPMIAETLRERYGVPVEWGADAERLRRFLPGEDPEDDEPAPTPDPAKLAEILLGVVDAGLVPTEIRGLVVQALKDQAADIDKAPSDRIKEAQQALTRTWYSREDRQAFRRRLGLAAAEEQALHHASYLDASRAVWTRLAQWRRGRGRGLACDVGRWQRRRETEATDLARGTNPRTGAPYTAATLYAKRRYLAAAETGLADVARQVEQLVAVEIPTYRAWRAMMAGLIVARPASRDEDDVPPPATEALRACHQALMRRHERLAEEERLLALERAHLIGDRGAFEGRQRVAEAKLLEDRETLESERAQLRDDVLAGVQRDQAALLAEVGELEQRRRQALAMLAGLAPIPATAAPSPASAGVQTSPVTSSAGDLRERLLWAGITQHQLATVTGRTDTHISRVLSGTSRSAYIVKAAEVLIAEASRKGTPGPLPAAVVVPPGVGRLGVAHPALAERLRQAGITHATIAAAVPCSRPLVAQVLNGRTAERRGITTAVVPTAERLLAETTGEQPPERPAPSADLRGALVQERGELNELRRALDGERAKIAADRRAIVEQQRRLERERQNVAHAAEVARFRQVAASLPGRLERAAITRTELARAARRQLSVVSKTLNGTDINPHVVTVAVRMLAKKLRRR
jgi:hypothetical protein